MSKKCLYGIAIILIISVSGMTKDLIQCIRNDNELRVISIKSNIEYNDYLQLISYLDDADYENIIITGKADLINNNGKAYNLTISSFHNNNAKRFFYIELGEKKIEINQDNVMATTNVINHGISNGLGVGKYLKFNHVNPLRINQIGNFIIKGFEETLFVVSEEHFHDISKEIYKIDIISTNVVSTSLIRKLDRIFQKLNIDYKIHRLEKLNNNQYIYNYIIKMIILLAFAFLITRVIYKSINNKVYHILLIMISVLTIYGVIKDNLLYWSNIINVKNMGIENSIYIKINPLCVFFDNNKYTDIKSIKDSLVNDNTKIRFFEYNQFNLIDSNGMKYRAYDVNNINDIPGVIINQEHNESGIIIHNKLIGGKNIGETLTLYNDRIAYNFHIVGYHKYGYPLNFSVSGNYIGLNDFFIKNDKNVIYTNNLGVISSDLLNKAMLVTPVENNYININNEINQYATVFSVKEMIEIEKYELYEKMSKYFPYVMIEVIYLLYIFLLKRQSRNNSTI